MEIHVQMRCAIRKLFTVVASHFCDLDSKRMKYVYRCTSHSNVVSPHLLLLVRKVRDSGNITCSI